MVISPVDGWTVATSRLALVSPAPRFRSEELGTVVPLGNTVRKVDWVGPMPVTLTTAAVAPTGTPARPRTLIVIWLALPPSMAPWAVHWLDGLNELAGRVSQTRTGADSAL